MARPTPLSNPEFAKSVAAAFVSGLTHKDIAAQFGIHPDTVTSWRRDPRVKAHAMKMIEDRVIAVTRRIDAIIEGRLQHADNLSMKDLVMLRKEMLGGTLRAQTENADDATISEVMTALDKNPDLADQLQALVESGGKLPEPATD